MKRAAMSEGRSFDVTISDVPYLEHETGSLSVRVHKPVGDGLFPAVIDVHGGAWCVGTNRNNDTINRALAARGIVVASLDFRMPPVAAYPAAVADVNFGVRWLKANAATFGSTSEMVGTIGTSSGGHLTVLTDTKPRDPRYSAIQRNGVGSDASVPYAVTLWPVICPQGRYRYLKSIPPSNTHAVFAEGISRHEAFWGDEAAMAEGSPVCALERGDPVILPHVLYVQNEQDQLHPRVDMDRFVSSYANAGGNVAVEMYRGAAYDALRVEPDTAESQRVFDVIAKFIWAEAQKAARRPAAEAGGA
jgi:acetyl esterase/lipase